MCEYCTDDITKQKNLIEIPIDIGGNAISLNIFIFDECALEADWEDMAMGNDKMERLGHLAGHTMLNYCPMCGRKF